MTEPVESAWRMEQLSWSKIPRFISSNISTFVLEFAMRSILLALVLPVLTECQNQTCYMWRENSMVYTSNWVIKFMAFADIHVRRSCLILQKCFFFSIQFFWINIMLWTTRNFRFSFLFLQCEFIYNINWFFV